MVRPVPGDPSAFPAEWYDELKLLARKYLRAERLDHTLQPTALIHEAYLKLGARLRESDLPRGDLLAAAAQAMRQILVDYARTRKRIKRGRNFARTEMDPDLLCMPDNTAQDSPPGLEELDQALSHLATIDAQAAKIVELRFFGGLSVEQAAETLEISPRSAARLWQFARAWLFDALTRDP